MNMKMKARWISIILCFVMVFGMIPTTVFAAATSGETGDVAWSLDEEGIFTVSGTGAMEDYEAASERPWDSYADQIKKVEIGTGVTNVGAYAFANCINLSDVNVGDTVTTIGAYAFENTTSLTELVLPQQVTVLCEGMFHDSGIKKLYVYSRKTQFDGFWSIGGDDDSTIPLDTVIYCYDCSHAAFYFNRPTVIMTDDVVMNIDSGNSTFALDPNNDQHVVNLLAASEAEDGSADSIVLDYTVSLNTEDANRIHNLMVDDSYKIGTDYQNNGNLSVDVELSLRQGDYNTLYTLRAGASYNFWENNLEGEANSHYGTWNCWSNGEFLTVTGDANGVSVDLNVTMEELYDLIAVETDATDYQIDDVFLYISVEGTSYRIGYGGNEYENKSTTIESAAISLYDVHLRESEMELQDILTVNKEMKVLDYAPYEGSLSAEEYAKYFEPVSREYTWNYVFSREAYIYNEETGEDVFLGDDFWESDGVVTEEYNGILYGGFQGSYNAGSDSTVTLCQMLSEEELTFVETLKGVEPTGNGGEVHISLDYTLVLTYADGTKVELYGEAAHECTMMAGVCLHTCTVCGMCTSEELLACNSQYGTRINACTCDEPQPDIEYIAVDDAVVVESNTYSGEVTVRVETFDIEKEVTTDYFKAVTSGVGPSETVAVYDITIYNEYGEAVKINEWGGTDEYVTVSIPVSADIAIAAAAGDMGLYHVDENGIAEPIAVTVDTVNNTLTFTSTQFSPFVLLETVPYYGRAQLALMSNATALLYAYDKIALGVEASSETITVYNGTNALSQDELTMVMDAYRRDYAHHFWLGNTYQIASDSTSVLSIKPTYILSGYELEMAKDAFNQKVTSILSELTSSMSECEIELYLHDKLAEMITYEEGTNAHNAYGALVEGKAVCEGYAESLQYLLQRAGIQSFLAIGASINPSTGLSENHEWNYVRINDNYYHTDLTWDDQGENLFHAYFNQTDTVIKENHTINATPYALPTCNATAEQYFTGKTEYLSTYTADKVGKLLKDNDFKVHVYIPDSIDEFWTWYQANISNIATQAGINSSFSYGYMQLGRELILTINIICEHTALTLEPAAEPYCTTAGYHAYYKCSCGAYFEDSSASTKIPDIEAWKDGDGKINALGHEYNEKIQDNDHLKEIADKCTEYNTYWYDCSRCNANAKDDNNARDKYWTSTVAGSHSYTEKLADNAHFVTGSGANCQDAKKYYYDCAYCDTIGTSTWASSTFGEHEYDTTKWGYQDLDEGHAHKCKYCVEHDDVQPHTPGAEATEDTDQICTTCEMVLVPASGHICKNHLTLKIATGATCTDDGHEAYYQCSCNACYEDAMALVPIADINEWKVGDGKIPALGHDYAEKMQDENHLKIAATNCTEYNTYWYDCSRCNVNAKDDNTATDKFWTSAVAGSHVFTEKLTDNAHFVTGSGATCQNAKEYYYDCAYCDTVGTTIWASTVYGEHKYTEQIADELHLVAGSGATCQDAKLYYYDCVYCDTVGTTTWVSTTYGSHDYDTTQWGYQDKNQGHAHKCKYCVEHDDVQPHTPGAEATEDTNQICTTCQMVLVPATGHICKNHLTLKIATGATCTDDGHEAYYQCSCNACYEDAMALAPIADINAWKAGDGKIPALGHDYTEKIQDASHLKATATKCTEYDTYWYACSRCDAIAKNDGTATDKYWTSNVAGSHDFTEKLTDNAHFVTGSGATCQNAKEYYYDCAYCDTVGTTKWISTAHGEHKYTEQIADDSHLVAGSGATCQDAKLYYYDCEYCGTVGTTTWVSTTYGSHDYDTTQWGYQDKNQGHAHKCKYCVEHDEVQPHTPGLAATEDDPQICTTCLMVLVPATGHICKNHLTLKTAKGATCTDDGHEAYYQCSCNACYEDAMALVPIPDINAWKAGDGKIPALGHDYTEKIQDASHLKATATKCTEYDTYWYDCSRCDAIAKNDGAATDKYWISNVEGSHNFTEKLTDNAHFVTGSGVNCQDVKEYYFDCVYCETIGTTTWASTTYGEHEFDLTQWGYQDKNEGHAHKCKYCNEHDAIQPHNPGAEATEDTDQTCTTCHMILVPATGHLCKNHLTLQTAAGASCTVDGNIEYYKCSCGEYYKDALATEKIIDKSSVIIKASHNYGELILQIDATHTTTELKDGMKAHYFCETCDTFFDENKKVVTKDELVIIAPTHNYGSDWGYKGEDGHAHSCSCGLKEEVFAHTPSDEATETMPQTCVQCGFVLQPALGHTHKISKVDATAASCASAGNKEYYICETCDGWFEDALGLVAITNKESVVISALTSHNDKDNDGKCDDCANVIEETKKPSDLDSPKTGEGHSIWLFVALLFVSGFGIIKITALDKKKVYKK